VDARAAFECIVDDLEYPMFVVSVAVDDDQDACLVGFTTQCSIDPPRFAVFLSKNNHTYELASRADLLAVHRHVLGRIFSESTLLALCEQPDICLIYGAPFFGAERHGQEYNENHPAQDAA